MSAQPAPTFAASYYSASSSLPALAPPLLGTVQADVCVVGGGIAGCSAALSLAQRGYRVVLLEAERIGWGASGRSGGQVLYGTAVDQAALEQQVGVGDARRIWDLSVEAVTLLKQRIAEHRIDCDWVDGQMLTAVKARQWDDLQRWHDELSNRYGYYSTQLIERESLQQLLPSRRYCGALYDANSGHLHPLRYTLGLAQAARQAGAHLYEASRAIDYVSTAAGVRVRTERGLVDCWQLLLAGNAWLGDTAPALRRKLLSVTSYVIATQPLGERRAQQLIQNNAAVCDTNWVLDYFRRSADHRLLFGGRVNYSNVDLRAVAPATRARMLQVFPQLADVRVEFAWGCLLDLTLNRAPHFGRLQPNVYFLQGFAGHGIALAGIAGRLVAEAVAGTAERFDVFGRIRHRDFPGGMLLRRPTLALAMLWYRMRDLL